VRSDPKLFLLALLLPGWLACGKPASEEVATTDKVPVATVAAHLGSIRATVLVTGVVKPAPGAELQVTAPQSARIAALPKAEGDRVRRGDLLVRFEIPSLEADQASRGSDLSRAEARRVNARAALERVTGLFGRGIAARKEVEDAQREAAEAEAGVEEAKSARTAAGLLAGRVVVRAPFDGVVAARLHNPGDLVEAGNGDPILRILDPARLQVEASVPLNELAYVAQGNPARISGPATYPPATASVLTRPAAVDPATGAATVRLAFAQPTPLPAGTPVQVEILGPEHRQALLVPTPAVLQEGTESYVYTVDPAQKAHRHRVEVGLAASGQSEILAGLAPGDRVIVQGQHALPDGAEVSVSR